MKIFHMGDIHYAPEHMEEVDRCCRFAIASAIERDADIAVLAGDLTDHRLDLNSPTVAPMLDAILTLADAMPVLVLQGTLSHDAPGMLEALKRLRANHPIYVADRLGQVMWNPQRGWIPSDGWCFEHLPEVEDGVLFACLPAVNKGEMAAQLDGVESTGGQLGEAVYSLLKGWSPIHQLARTRGIPSVVVSHGTVSGCVTEHGVPMSGLDWEYTVGSLFAASATAAMLAHIHQHQEWEQDGHIIAYPGSVGRLHYGELEPKGFLIWTLFPDRATTEFVETPSKRMIHAEFSGTPDQEELRAVAADCAAAFVRLRIRIDEDYRHTVDRSALKQMMLDAGAKECKVEIIVNPIQRSRAEGVNGSGSLAEKVTTWARLTETESSPLVDRLALIESQEPEEICASINAGAIA